MKKILLFLMLALFCIPLAANAQQTLPYSYGFENGDPTTDGWVQQGFTGNYSGAYDASEFGFTAHGGDYFFSFEYDEENAYLMSPILIGGDLGVEVTFYYNEYSDSYGDEQFQVGYTTDETETDASLFTYGEVVTASMGDWQVYTNTFPAGTKRIAIKYIYNNAYFLFVDDFTFEPVSSCAKPATFTVSTITAYGAVFEWENTGVGNYQFEYKKATEEEWVTGMTHDASYTLSNLTQNTAYNARVKAVCGTGNESGYKTLDFTTLIACPAPTNVEASDITVNGATISWNGTSNSYNVCYAIETVAFFDDFENGLDNWTIIRNGEGNDYTDWRQFDPSNFSSGQSAHSGNYVAMSRSWSSSAYSVDNWLISPQVSLDGTLKFWMMDDGSYHEHFDVYVSTTGNEISDFTLLYEPGNASSTWTEVVVDLSTYHGVQGYIALRHTDYDQDFLLIDDIGIYLTSDLVCTTTNETTITLTGLADNTNYGVTVQGNCGDDGLSTLAIATITTLPLCEVPTNLAYSNVTPFTADLAWTAGGEETAWQICVNGDEENLIDVITNTHTLTGLTDETAYTVKVRANCGGDNGTSEWSAAVSFTTPVACPAPTNIAASDITADGATISWNGDAENYVLEWAEVPAEVSVSTNGDILVLQYDDYDNVGSFTGIGSTTAAYRTWGVMYPAAMLQGNNTLTKVAVQEYSSWWSVDSAYTVNIYVGGETAPETQVASETVTFAGGMHQITLSQPVTIDPAKNLWITVTAHGTYVMTACNANNYNNQWEYANGEWISLSDNSSLSDYGWMIRGYVTGYNPSDYEWNSVTNATSPYHIEGLDPETFYYVKVKAVCGGEYGESEWTWGGFTTTPTCLNPTGLSAEDITATSADLSWTANSEETAWTLYWKESGAEEYTEVAVTAKPYTLSGLNAATTYEFYVVANCSETDASPASDVFTFTTAMCALEDQCELTFELTDSWGDSWNGNAIRVVDVLTGVVLGELANENLNGTSGSGENEVNIKTLSVCDGREIQFVWVSGSYPSETSYTVYDRNGEVIFEGSGALSAPVNYVVDCTVPACPKPKDLAYAINADGATISWTGESDSYNVQLGFNNAIELLSKDFADGIPADWTNDETYAWTVVDGHIQSGNAGVGSSTSSISATVTLPADGTIEFDAECMGEGTSSYWDHCDFYIDDTRMLYAGANISDWNHYKFDIPAGEHTVAWSYTKDSSVNPTGDYFAVDNVVVKQNNIVWADIETATETEHTFTIQESGEYLVHVQGVCDGVAGDWSETLTFDFTPVNCEAGIVLNEANPTWKENFDGITTITAPVVVEVQPSCWTWNRTTDLPEGYVDTLPHLYYNSSYAHSGSYSLRLWNRGVYAMPVLDENVNINRVKMSFYSRHSYSFYTMMVGVMTNPNDPSTFVPVAYVDNGSSTDVKYFECDFSKYDGQGRYIAFKNVRSTNSELDGHFSDVHSVNYIDDIVLTLMPESSCTIELADLPYTENFDAVTSSTNTVTGASPRCWEVVEGSENMSLVTAPQVYYNWSFAWSGYYTLRMANRGVYAMPALSEDINIKEVQLSMYVRQPNALYQLQVGVWDEVNETFTPVALVNNSTTGLENFTCDFSNYDGSGRRIAFRNILGGGKTWNYSYNYIDNVVLSQVECEKIPADYSESFEDYTDATTAATGAAPTCWDVVEGAETMSYDGYPQVYYNSSFANDGYYSLRMSDRCVYAMPELAEGISLGSLSMTMYVRQPNTFYQLEVGVWDGTEFTVVETVNNSDDAVTEVTVDFAGYESGRIAFRNTLNGGMTWNYSYNYIDDISFGASTGSKSEIVEGGVNGAMDNERYLDNIAVYPNPTTGVLHIDAVDVQKVECYSQMGQLVGVYDNVNELNISELADGVYMLRITVPQGVTMRKVVKR